MFKRMYVDLPDEQLHAAFKARAAAAGKSMKTYLAEIIARECGAVPPSDSQPKRRKARGKKGK